MLQTVPFLSVQGACQSIVEQVVSILQQEDLQVVRTFDLQEALKVHPGCSCPRHGSNQCNCQMVVLLVYDSTALKTGQFVTLIADGQDLETHFSLASQNLPINLLRFEGKIRQRLVAALLPSEPDKILGDNIEPIQFQ